MKRLWAAIRALHDYLTDAGYLIGAAVILLMGGIYCVEVVLRYFFNAPTRWSTETVSNLMLVMIFASFPHATRSLNHIAVTLIQDLWPSRARAVGAVINLTGVVLCGFVAYLSFSESMRQFVQQIETVANIPIPKWWVSSWIAYGFGSSTLWYLRLLCEPGPIHPRMKFIRSSVGQGATQ